MLKLYLSQLTTSVKLFVVAATPKVHHAKRTVRYLLSKKRMLDSVASLGGRLYRRPSHVRPVGVEGIYMRPQRSTASTYLHAAPSAASLHTYIPYRETLWHLMTTCFSEASYIVDAAAAAAVVMVKSQQSYGQLGCLCGQSLERQCARLERGFDGPKQRRMDLGDVCDSAGSMHHCTELLRTCDIHNLQLTTHNSLLV